MAQLERMDICLDTLTAELYQVNTHVSRIGGFTASPSPSPSLSPQASDDKNDDDEFGNDDDDDEDEDASSSSDEEITASQ